MGRSTTTTPRKSSTSPSYKVQAVLRAVVEHFDYEYDFGDSWSQGGRRRPRLVTSVLKHGVCLDGREHVPQRTWAEPGVIRTSSRRWPTRHTMSTTTIWTGSVTGFDPAEFNIAGMNADLQRGR